MESIAHIARENAHRSAGGVNDVSLAQVWRHRLAQVALHRFARRHPGLDLDGMSDFMKRDLGFLDGCAPYREDVRLR
ncbi:hypothetical protein [Rhizobium sp. RCC_161_2]|uniref:hypothetical protein n=1 Tax=Rhizobium sp. RCC_161_2 TaxID=3239219 RepID=UPI003523C8DF